MTRKVFVHVRSEGQRNWHNEGREFLRLPVVGEYIALESNGVWYRVDLVVHAPFEGDYSAEVYAVEVDHLEAHRLAHTDVNS